MKFHKSNCWLPNWKGYSLLLANPVTHSHTHTYTHTHTHTIWSTQYRFAFKYRWYTYMMQCNIYMYRTCLPVLNLPYQTCRPYILYFLIHWKFHVFWTFPLPNIWHTVSFSYLLVKRFPWLKTPMCLASCNTYMKFINDTWHHAISYTYII